jgi:uncharacterized protein (TIGR00730 family)
MTAPKARNTYGEGEVDRLISQLVAAVGLDANDDLIRRMIVTALDMDASEVARLDLKIASQSMVEMLNGYQVFSQDPHRAKVTVFGSARTTPDAADYQLAVDFGRAMAAMEWMVISGAGPGIMQAAIEGAGAENTYGVNIVLPFEQRAVDIIEGDPKLATFKYFFTRKLFFVKEADAFTLFPGGFGTLDEGFELLTLIQTGKSYPAPIVLLDHPGSTYWDGWKRFVADELETAGMVSPVDKSLFLHTHDVGEAVRYISHFYSSFHSMRYVGKRLVIRLRHPLPEGAYATLNDEFSGIVATGTIAPAEATKTEIKDDDAPELPRLAFTFDNRSFARLTEMIHRINDLGGEGFDEDVAPHDLVHDLEPDQENSFS